MSEKGGKETRKRSHVINAAVHHGRVTAGVEIRYRRLPPSPLPPSLSLFWTAFFFRESPCNKIPRRRSATSSPITAASDRRPAKSGRLPFPPLSPPHRFSMRLLRSAGWSTAFIGRLSVAISPVLTTDGEKSLVPVRRQQRPAVVRRDRAVGHTVKKPSGSSTL